MEGLSVERLTLLGRVHVARVMIDSLLLNFEELSQEATPTKRKAKAVGKGKPPRPSPKPKKNWLEKMYSSVYHCAFLLCDVIGKIFHL